MPDGSESIVKEYAHVPKSNKSKVFAKSTLQPFEDANNRKLLDYQTEEEACGTTQRNSFGEVPQELPEEPPDSFSLGGTAGAAAKSKEAVPSPTSSKSQFDSDYGGSGNYGRSGNYGSVNVPNYRDSAEGSLSGVMGPKSPQLIDKDPKEGFPKYPIFMGNDKYENELLIKWGWPEDVWFHVSDFSSAHVYVRLPPNTTIDQIPSHVIDECCQVVKANSIEGKKHPCVDVIYTPWSNLHKDERMDVGTVGFKDQKLVKTIRNVAKNKPILSKIEKTQTTVVKDIEKSRMDRDRKQILIAKEDRKSEFKRQQEAEEKSRAQYITKHYLDLKPDESESREHGDGTIESCRKYEQDFM